MNAPHTFVTNMALCRVPVLRARLALICKIGEEKA